MHSVDVTDRMLRFADHALGRPYHAALVVQPGSAGTTEPHGHADFVEFMGILDGAGEQVLPSGTQTLRAGDVAMARPRDEHALAGKGPSGMRFVNIAFPVAPWRSFVDIARAQAWESADCPPLWRLGGREAQQAQNVFRTALDRFHCGPTMLDILRFWTDLVELLSRAEAQADAIAAARPEWLSKVCEQMRTENELRGGVRRMAKLAAVSQAHLSRSMRAHYGRTPTAFITELRLERAAQLLGTTTDPVTRIAHRCGFSSQSYFSRCFAAAYGTSPIEYRHNTLHAFVPS